MKINITDDRFCKLQDVPEDEMLVVYKSKLCIRDGRDQLYTTYGEMLNGINGHTLVSRIKSISVELV